MLKETLHIVICIIGTVNNLFANSKSDLELLKYCIGVKHIMLDSFVIFLPSGIQILLSKIYAFIPLKHVLKNQHP